MSVPSQTSSEIPQPEAMLPVRRDGFALPMAIMVLALLTMGLVAGFAMSASEQGIGSTQRAQSRAYSMAQMGLEQFIARRKEVINSAGAVDTFCKHCWAVNRTYPASGSGVKATLDTLPAQRETTVVALTGGSAVVRAWPVYVNAVTGKGTYYITSTGIDSLSGIARGKGLRNYPTRTVGVFVTWNTMTMNVVGALVGLGGISKNGTGQVSGIDECGKKASVAGVSTPTGEMDMNGNSFNPTGSPPFDTLNTFSAESASLKLDWAGVKAGITIQADITVPASAFPDWPTFAADTNYWPVIHVTDPDFPLPNKGRGLLIVDGNLTINGSDQWDGVILIGGKLTSNGNNVMSGTVMSGLNYLLTGPPTGLKNPSVDNSVANGQKSYQYNSCAIDKATSSMARYSIVPNSWMDNVAGY